MLALIILLAAGTPVHPSDAEAKKLYGAIWSDLQLNGMIGNGAWLASLWVNAGDIGHIRDLTCDGLVAPYRCTFRLVRDGGPTKVFGEDAPETLTCEARFVIAEDEKSLAVDHLPPLNGIGHSRTTMKCDRPPS